MRFSWVRLLVASAIGLAVYLLSGALLIDGAEASFFPRELVVLSLAGAAVALSMAWTQPLAWLAAAACLAVAGFLFIPEAAPMRLALLHAAIPIEAPRGEPGTAGECFCGTRASILMLFGRPDFTSGGSGIGLVYAYWLTGPDARRDAAVYHFSEEGGSEDRLIRFERRVGITDAELEAAGLRPYGRR